MAALVSNKPHKASAQDVLDHVWSADEATAFLKAAKAAGPQPAAFYTLALDTGARRGELAALRWADVDLHSGKLTIRRTLLKCGRVPVFGETKTKTVRKASPKRFAQSSLPHQTQKRPQNQRAFCPKPRNGDSPRSTP